MRQALIILGLGLLWMGIPAQAAKPTIFNVAISSNEKNIVVRWQTDSATTAKITFADQTDPHELNLDELGGAKTNHEFTLIDAPVGHTFLITIQVTTPSGETASYSETYLHGTGTNSTTTSPPTQPGASPTPTICPTGTPMPGQTNSSPCLNQGGQINPNLGPENPPSKIAEPSKPGDPDFSAPAWFSQPLFAIGSTEVRGIDFLWWVAVFLLGLTTLLEIFFYQKRRRLWGVVYDARTKQPLEMAVVRLFDQEHHKLLETRVTPRSGRYSFLAEPGEYYLDVTKEGYHFPSRIVTAKIDNEYTNIYRGEILKLGAGQSLIAVDIPIDSESGEIHQPSPLRKLYPVLDSIRLPLLVLTFIALLAYLYFAIPTLIAQLAFALVAILFVVELLIRRGRR